MAKTIDQYAQEMSEAVPMKDDNQPAMKRDVWFASALVIAATIILLASVVAAVSARITQIEKGLTPCQQQTR